MRLKTVKLSGFKSFVDPTNISFPADLTAIVGPNGCGKSNVIDAVRWVLGESSAKNLRSQSMAEVVFNGSSSRKPVSRASIELIFDNSEGRIGGEYASYSEISVRRVHDIEGQSNYYLNGTSCRKRDITDLFLGTGLGPRNYAIIEQGMIERLVSSKPEEMRGYIEEVAGISRYLERRKETESRIRRTKENLSRLEDLREEIGRLLFKLKQQARAAERYSELREEESLLKGKMRAYQWQTEADNASKLEEEVRLQQIEVEKINTSKTTSDAEVDILREKQSEIQLSIDKIQQEFYSAGADISRAEQAIQSERENITSSQDKLSLKNQTLSERKRQLHDLNEEEKNINKLISEISPKLDDLRNKQFNETDIDGSVNQIISDWQDYHSRINMTFNELKKLHEIILRISKGEVDKARIEETRIQLKELNQTLDSLAKEPPNLVSKVKEVMISSSEASKEERLDLLDRTQEFADLQAKLATCVSQIKHNSDQISGLNEEITDFEEKIKVAEEPLKEKDKELEGLLESRLIIENKMKEARASMDEVQERIRSIERQRVEKEQLVSSSRESLQDMKLKHQEKKLEAKNIEKLITEEGQNLKELLEHLDSKSDLETYQSELEAIERKIARLGAINLAAMEEHEQEEKRKEHLDAQNEELLNALSTLENAIAKIDKETRTTFKDTFDKLNSSLAVSFPKLFGGGHAELILLGDDLLTSGVGIVARPPGKKNASVAQLSGGEKALTAISLVFAFFELNPAPFCLLDEVDAPLDDLNTMRFISLVEEMSERVQFVYITHNKISMERSKHLMGVTMQEPGVSKLVAVDVEEAVRISGTA